MAQSSLIHRSVGYRVYEGEMRKSERGALVGEGGSGESIGRRGRSIHKERVGEGRSVQKERKEKQMTPRMLNKTSRKYILYTYKCVCVHTYTHIRLSYADWC